MKLLNKQEYDVQTMKSNCYHHVTRKIFGFVEPENETHSVSVEISCTFYAYKPICNNGFNSEMYTERTIIVRCNHTVTATSALLKAQKAWDEKYGAEFERGDLINLNIHESIHDFWTRPDEEDELVF